MKTLSAVSLFIAVSLASSYVKVDILTRTTSNQFCGNETLCTTLSQCLLSISECISENSTLEFEPGIHSTTGLSGMMMIRNVHNVSLLGRNSTIECEMGVGFFFNRTDHLHISGLVFQECGAELLGNVVANLLPSQDRRTFQGAKSSVIISNSYDVNLRSIRIRNGNGYGLFAVNLLGQSGIYDSIITHSNYRAIRHYQHDFSLCEDPDNLDCSGGGLVLLYDECRRCSSGVHRLEVSGVVVEHSVNLQQWDVMFFTEAAGGLTISLWQSNTFSAEITVRDCILDSNTGFYAGNAAMNFQHGSNFDIRFLNTSFFDGNPEIQYYRDRSRSGGLYCNWQQGYPLDQTGYSKILIIDNCTFANNSALQGGALCIHSIIDDDILETTLLEMRINNTNILYNQGHVAIVKAQEDNSGESSVPTNSLLITLNNTRIYDNAPLNSVSETKFYIISSNSSLYVSKVRGLVLANLLIAGNKMRGFHALNVAQFTFIGANYITENIADNGGGMKLRRSSFLMSRNAYLYVANNRATMHGGGIFIEEDSSSASNRCFFNLANITNISEPQIIVSNNYANLSGHSIYGGRIESCQFDNALSITGYDAFNKSFEIPYNRSLTEISSTIHQLCFCSNERPHCSVKTWRVTTYPGQSFSLPAVAVGQLDGTTVDTAISYLLNTTGRGHVSLGSQQRAQNLYTTCTQLNYSLSSGENEVGVIGVQTNYGRTRLPNSILLLIVVHTEACPLGFSLNQLTMSCDCNMFLRGYSVMCFIDEQYNNIQRLEPVWIGYDSDKNLLLAHDSCPLSYCISGSVNFSLTNGTDLQCQFGHSGILCGGCQENFSVVFGNQACRKCSDQYLSLLLVFFLAGLVLVGIMIFGNLTISQGRFNGLIFYANIVRVHHSILFPPHHVNVITVFIAWLNLDLGFEACFYDGMDAYARVWLQYAFPVYVWFLVACIIVLGYYSRYAAKLFGNNAVQVLATLLLLSYTKIQRIVLETWSSTLIRHENGSFSVWLIDGNVHFLNGKHVFLSVMSIVAVLVFILPFTLIILCEYPLQSKFGTAMLRYRLTALIDAYQGPYKTRFRWWTGAMLLVRSALLTAFSVNIFGDPSLNLELILSLCVVMLGLLWNAGTIYKERLINMLESFFIVNLGLLSGWTVFNRYSSPKHLVYQKAISYTLVGACFAVFICIVGSEMYVSIKKKVITKFPCFQEKLNDPEPRANQVEKLTIQTKKMSGNTLREPLIEDV